MSDTTFGLRHQPLIATAAGLIAPGTDPADAASVTSVIRDRDETWLLTDRRHLEHRSGRTSRVVADLPGRGNAVVVHRGEVFVGGDDASLWRLDVDRIVPVESFWTAPTRDEWHTPWGGPPSVFSMAAHGDDLYVAVHVGGIIHTSDRGATWEPTIDLHVDVHEVAVDDRGVVYAATGMRGLATSDDRGATWHFHDRGLHARYALSVAPTTDGVVLAVSSGHAARDGRINRFDGERFEDVAGLPDDFGGAVGPGRLVASGDEALVALPNGDVYASTDGGRHWTLAIPGVGSVNQVAFAAA